MPSWANIEDASARPNRVWLGRVRQEALPLFGNSGDAHPATKSVTISNSSAHSSSHSTSSTKPEPWRPLRKIDCAALNAAWEQSPVDSTTKTVYIEEGRATADPTAGMIFNNFFRAPLRDLTAASWFVREEKSNSGSNKQLLLHPVSDEQDSEKIEALYQKAIKATSSLGNGIASVLEDEVTLSDDAKVKIFKSGGNLAMRKFFPGWFSAQVDLQRGYGEYTVEGEEEERILGPVGHLFFVIHGIGEAMFSRDDIMISSMIEQMNTTRISIQKRQVQEWKKACEKAKKDGKKPPAPPNRIEFLPIEWFNRVHDSSSELMKSLQAVTLSSIPTLRRIANDIVFDVLLYMTPSFCEAVLECVTQQLIDLHALFLEIHPTFSSTDGKVSLIGHSLGSVIAWDLLAILKDHSSKKQSSFRKKTAVSPNAAIGSQADVGIQAYATNEHANTAQHGTCGPSLTKRMKKVIPFVPETTLLLGSPMGMFLTLRGAHALFDGLRDEEAQCKKRGGESSALQPSPFTLPTGSLYNIFNLSDPVAYRIEPLLLPQHTKEADIPAPVYLTAPGKDVRLHVKAMQIGDEVRKSLKEPRGAFNFLLESAVSALSNGDSTSLATRSGPIDSSRSVSTAFNFPLSGRSERVDFSFQPAVIDNEYLSAVLAHSTSTYFNNSDFLEFLIKHSEI